MTLDIATPSPSPSPGPSAGLVLQQSSSVITQDRAHSSASRSPEQSNTPSAYLSISGSEDGQVARLPVFVPTPETEADGLFLTQDIPINKGGFSYIPCAPSPISSPSPHYPFLRSIPQFADVAIPHLSFSDRSAHLRVSPSAMTASSATGFRSGRATTPVRSGSFYCEFLVDRGGGDIPTSHTSSATLDGAHVRLGWGRKEASLNSPVGLDGYSYGVRDKTGEKVTCSRTKRYFDRGFRTGDVVGLWISLPEEGKGKGREVVWEEGNIPTMVDVPEDPTADENNQEQDQSSVEKDTHPDSKQVEPLSPGESAARQIVRQRIPIRYKSQLYFETVDPPPTKEMDTLMLPPPKSAAAPAAPTGTTSTGNGKRKKSTRITNKTLPSVDSMRPAIGAQPLRPLPVLKGSKIAFFVNGSSPGYAFTDLFDYRPLPPFPSSNKKTVKSKSTTQTGTGLGAGPNSGGPTDDGTLGYYPFLSVYGGGRVTFNPGPDFKYPPPDDIESYLESQERKQQPTSTPASVPISGPESDPTAMIKPEPGSEVEIAPAAPSTTAPDLHRTWLPLSARYEEYMKEHRALDERDEREFLRTYVPPPDPDIGVPSVRPKAEKRKSSTLVPTTGQTDDLTGLPEHHPVVGSTETAGTDKPTGSFPLQGLAKKAYKKSRLGLTLSSDDEPADSRPHTRSPSPSVDPVPSAVYPSDQPETTSMGADIHPTDVLPHSAVADQTSIVDPPTSSATPILPSVPSPSSSSSAVLSTLPPERASGLAPTSAPFGLAPQNADDNIIPTATTIDTDIEMNTDRSENLEKETTVKTDDPASALSN